MGHNAAYIQIYLFILLLMSQSRSQQFYFTRLLRSNSMANRAPSFISGKEDKDSNPDDKYSHKAFSVNNDKKKKKNQINYPSSSSEEQRILNQIQDCQILLKGHFKEIQNANRHLNQYIQQKINAARNRDLQMVNMWQNEQKQTKQYLKQIRNKIKELRKEKGQLHKQLQQHRLHKKFPSIK